MMLLPKTNVVFSSVRDNLSAIEPSGGPESSTESKRSTSSTKGKSEEPKRKVSTCHDQMSPKFCSQTQIGEANGWIVTVVADDFNVYVFHQFKLNNDDPRNMGGVGASSFGYNFGIIFPFLHMRSVVYYSEEFFLQPKSKENCSFVAFFGIFQFNHI